jgi:hypothetical protein
VLLSCFSGETENNNHPRYAILLQIVIHDIKQTKTTQLDTQIPDHKTQAYRVKRRDKPDANPHIFTHNINAIGMSALPDKTAKRAKRTSTRRKRSNRGGGIPRENK